MLFLPFYFFTFKSFFTGEIIPVPAHADTYADTHGGSNQKQSNIHSSILLL